MSNYLVDNISKSMYGAFTPGTSFTMNNLVDLTILKDVKDLSVCISSDSLLARLNKELSLNLINNTPRVKFLPGDTIYVVKPTDSIKEFKSGGSIPDYIKFSLEMYNVTKQQQ